MNLLFWYRSLMRSVGAALVKLIATATSGLVSFTTNVIRPVKVVCEFSPVQEGTGDPSPDNVRPISGWTGCKIGHSGDDFMPNATYVNQRILNPEGSTASNGPYCYTGSYQDVGSKKYIVCTLSNVITNRVNICFYDSEEQYKSGVQPITRAGVSDYENWRAVIPVPEECQYFRWSVLSSERSYLHVNTADVIDVTFTDPSTGDPMTVYGGTVTLNEDGSADLGSEWMALNPASLSYQYIYGDFVTMVSGANLDRTSGKVTILCNKYNGIKNKLPASSPDMSIWARTNAANYIIFTDSRFNDAADFKSSLGDDTIVVYKTTVPTTYHFDNIGQLNTFLGTNNIWHDMNGSITAEYYKKQ